MVYIVSDERIAVENFEQGKIYKVDFVDESVLYGVCVGIGSDFVMLSGDISGYIFPLTMQTASQVTSIDLYDPTPPEPPVPWTNLLQYQTGVPGFNFNTTDTSLFSWYIEGEGVGDKTANLFDKDNAIVYNASLITSNEWRYSDDSSSVRIQCEPNTEYTLSVQTLLSVFRVAVTSSEDVPLSQGDTVSSTRLYSYNGRIYATVTTLSDSKYLIFQGSKVLTNTWLAELVVNTGSTVPSEYIPYGYKIPILCNEHLTNIYLDAPLSEGEILYSTDIDTAIVTDIGDNDLSVETTQQPTAMQIVYKIADR